MYSIVVNPKVCEADVDNLLTPLFGLKSNKAMLLEYAGHFIEGGKWAELQET